MVCLGRLREDPRWRKTEFLGKVFERGNAVPVPQDEVEKKERRKSYDEEVESSEGRGKAWYLAHLGVYPHKKPDQIRVVFDSSASIKELPSTKSYWLTRIL